MIMGVEIMTIRDFDISGFRCRDNVPSGFRVSGFWTDPAKKILGPTLQIEVENIRSIEIYYNINKFVKSFIHI
ncbi:uncharacterized protein OCT59_014821 [Rhizophagus irregularis]|uniref:uncharacterized protein n=1 Tax=Rhizophagus irregularis TaxID=588596 RepID=UPI003324E398|nr:hypothetical protein OCT59_014821 [Rhizophagus irregularis]